MSLIVVFEQPPFEILEGCRAAFNIAGKRGLLFCVGDRLYNPDRADIEPWLMRHEEVHSRRQLAAGRVNAWWSKYLTDKTFRFDEELLAHQAEWRAVQEMVSSRQQRRKWLAFIAGRLSGPIYGHMVTKERAKRLVAEA